MEVEEAGPGREGKSMKSVKRMPSFSQSTNTLHLSHITQCAGSGRCSGE